MQKKTEPTQSRMSETERVARAQAALGDRKISFLGAGRITGVIVERLLVTDVLDPAQICVSDVDPEQRHRLAQDWRIAEAPSNSKAVEKGDLMVMAVPPSEVLTVLEETASSWRDDQVLISLAAMVPTAAMEAALGREIPIVRVIPNVPSLVGSGMNPYCFGGGVAEPQARLAETFLDLLGSRARVLEDQMAAATALTGMGPTYVLPLIRALAEAGHDGGLDDSVALRFATETVLGTAAMVLETGRQPGDLRQLVPAATVDEGAVQEMFGGTIRKICQGLKDRESAMTSKAPAVSAE